MAVIRPEISNLKRQQLSGLLSFFESIVIKVSEAALWPVAEWWVVATGRERARKGGLSVTLMNNPFLERDTESHRRAARGVRRGRS
jgi:hypothetical protein